MRKFSLALLAVGLSILSSVANAAPLAISLNFSGNGGAVIPSGDVAGAPGASFTNWNSLIQPTNTPPFTGAIAAGGLKYDDGTTAATTAVNWNWTGDNGSGGAQGTGSNAQFQLSGRFDPFNGVGYDFQINVTNIPFATYDVYFYTGDGDGQPNRGGLVTIGAQTRAVETLPSNAANGWAYVESTATTWDFGGNTPVGNYVKFSGLTGASLTLITNTYGGRFQVSGMQIVNAVPEPGSALLAIFGGTFVFAAARRRQKRSA